MNHIRKIKMKTRRHYVLFDRDLPFKPKVVRDRTKYRRKVKHRKNED